MGLTRIGYRYFGFAGLVFLVALSGTSCVTAPPRDTVSLRVMSFNIWVGGESGGQPLSQTAEVIRTARADIVGVQEAFGREVDGVRPDNGAALAKLLGWRHVVQFGSRAIISRYPIASVTPERHGAVIELPDGGRLHFFNVHLYHAPYQPYQLLGIPYNDAPFLATESELIAAAHEARGDEIEAVMAEIEAALAAGASVVLTGDFNEPSHRDWTPRALAAGVVPMAVAYPTTQRVESRGLIDVYRSAYPDEARFPGRTWTPITAEDDPADRHDRIDMIFMSSDIRVVECAIVGEDAARSDIVVVPYPSDHRAVIAEIRVPQK